MRGSNRFGRGRRPSTPAAGFVALVMGLAVVACTSGPAATPTPTVVPTPVITPDPHLHEPVTADQIYAVLTAAKLGMNCPNANLGNGNPTIVKQINCSLGGWPLRITQYQSGTALARNLAWGTSKPGGDEAPFAWAALNVAVQFGPISARPPTAPDPSRQAVAAQVVGALDPVLWPLRQHSVMPIPARTPEPSATPAASIAPSKPPTKPPSKTPKPSRTP